MFLINKAFDNDTEDEDTPIVIPATDGDVEVIEPKVVYHSDGMALVNVFESEQDLRKESEGGEQAVHDQFWKSWAIGASILTLVMFVAYKSRVKILSPKWAPCPMDLRKSTR